MTPARQRYDQDSLLAVAAQVFTERGYDGTSMEDLAKVTGITKSSIYHHVQSKEEILRIGLDRALDALFAVFDEAPARDGRAVERLRYVVRRTVEVLVAELPYVTLLLRVRGNTATEQAALERRRAFDRQVRELFAEAVADGDLRAELDPALTERLVFGMINSTVEWYRPRSETTVDDLVAAVLAIVDGLRA
ncbi:MAG TPA: TetR/AcrR family transcriptional regulator [Mycobacteriales bacterium]|nr:TetR/AcrR family transcriptional regulator [Mycobacteriales bacterium]